MKSRLGFGISLQLVSMNVEIRALQDGFDLISSTIERLQENEVNRLEQALSLDKNLDEEDVISLHSDVHDNVELFYPRLFWGPFLISLYSVFESSLKELSELLRKELECELKMEEISGDLLEKAKRYFDKVLKVSTISESSHWETITQLRTVRNCFAHSNGRVGYELLGSMKIERLIEKDIGLTHHMDVIIVKQKFVKTSMDSVVYLIKELQDEYRVIWEKSRQP